MVASARPWKFIGYALMGIALYLFFMVATLPAYWLGEALSRTSNGVLALRNTHGTIWNGNGLLELRASGASALSSHALWELQLLPLLTGKLSLTVETRGDITLRSNLLLGPRSLSLRNTEWELAATQLPALYAPAMFISPTGNLHGKADEFTIDAGQVRGETQIRWMGAGSRLGALNELGDYLLVVHGDNGQATLRMETLRGDLRIAATGAWQPAQKGQLTLQGTLNTGARDDALKPLTALLQARREGDHYLLTSSTRLPLPAWLGPKP